MNDSWNFTFSSNEVFQLLQAAEEKLQWLKDESPDYANKDEEIAALTNACSILAHVQGLINDLAQVED